MQHTVHHRHRFEDDPRRGYRNPGDFLAAVMSNSGIRDRDQVRDIRLRALCARDTPGSEIAFLLPAAFTPSGIRAAAGSDEQGTYADPYGGFAVPPASVLPWGLGAVEADPTAGRTLPVRMDTPEVKIVARTDKDHSSSLTGGLTVTRTPETVDRDDSRMEMELVVLHASSLFGFAWATDDFLEINPSAFRSLIAAGFRDEMDGSLLREKISGSGAGEFLGALNSPAKIPVDKETGQAAQTIVAQNVITMSSRCWGYRSAIWLANPDTRVQLASAALPVGGQGVVPTFVPSTEEGRPDMLWGRPVFFTEHVPTLGTEGDLLLVNWGQYLEGLYQPLESAESVHVRWEQRETALKFWIRNAGAPWWRAALTPENGANTLSPIVTLQTRS